jgi:hypothetical protein
MASQLPAHQRVRGRTQAVNAGINSRSMDFGALAQYGLPGAALAVLAGLVYALIKRGFRVTFRAEVPKKRT